MTDYTTKTTLRRTCSSVSEDRLRDVVQDSIFGLKWLIIAWTFTIAFVRRIADSFHWTSVVVYLNAMWQRHYRPHDNELYKSSPCTSYILMMTLAITRRVQSFQASTVVKLLNQRWWIPVSWRNSNMTGEDMYTCCLLYTSPSPRD